MNIGTGSTKMDIFKDVTIYNEDNFVYCPRCQEQQDFDNGPWKNNE